MSEPSRGSRLWIVAAVVIAAGVLGWAAWRGLSRSDEPVAGPAAVSLSDIIRARGGGLGSKPGA